jgi:hypothetical protein
MARQARLVLCVRSDSSQRFINARHSPGGMNARASPRRVKVPVVDGVGK